MTPDELRNARNPLLYLAYPALLRAAKRARRLAETTGTPLVTSRPIPSGVKETTAGYRPGDNGEV